MSQPRLPMTRLQGSPLQVGPQGLVANVGFDEGDEDVHPILNQTAVGLKEPGRPPPHGHVPPVAALASTGA